MYANDEQNSIVVLLEISSNLALTGLRPSLKK
jgi:hypothetical protein